MSGACGFHLNDNGIGGGGGVKLYEFQRKEILIEERFNTSPLLLG